MPKRNLASEHEEEDTSTPSSSKRARTGSDEDDEQIRTRTQRDRKTKSKNARHHADGDDEDEEQADLETALQNTQKDEIDDEEFEVKFGSQVRAHLESKKRVQGTVAEHGIIEYVEMAQFMCHKFLKFTFGPQVNFIIGHNGSGKSAVLSAITVALGGKTASTGRGAGLKSFIREGQNQAEVTIHIKNQGDEAYKPKEYGKTIIISRRIYKEGSPTWKIMNASGKVVSTKKDELAAICDHMNIQVDNPMNVLTQDAARQFLSASAPQDKYKFFLKGTQLTQLSDEYELCLKNVTQTQKLLAVKKEAIPDLKVRMREATIRYEEAQKAREQKQKAIDLKKELAWSHVAGKQEELEKQSQEVGKLSKRLPKIKESVKKAEVCVITLYKFILTLSSQM
ncbi:P-loop containing nucleoside triphosphate hydrolase protein [Crepidotus variabilis]|uniref:P-loop containing nucleoside triphosphate hydrolase protein n=1 Tax=Crepidotus variabilis TaxID=179855 RepID=A0A9P6JJM1_9AGAR|nr:P-loop containing nucleoside triphosphate hydrolase protein [Crepidotus variabilis]